MGTQQLTITFAGICSHFRDVVPGIPHRVVIPDTSAVRFGYIQLAEQDEPARYFVLPHFAIIRTGPKTSTFSVPHLIQDGYIYRGARLTVLNAIENELTYEHSYHQTPSIRHYVSDYNISEDVVLGGRAAAYFDVYAGAVSTVRPKPDGAIHVVVTMHTDGPPRLLVTGFGSADTPSRPFVVELDSPDLLVGNMELDAADTDPTFDYLLHYLTARGGIPAVLARPTPGMGPRPNNKSPHQIARALEGLAKVIEHGGPTREQVMQISPDDLTPACSDTRYP